MKPLLDIQDLTIHFSGGQEEVPALRNVSLTVNRGEILALVGESGSGKSVTSLSILRLLPTPPAVFKKGHILYSPDGVRQTDLLKESPAAMQQLRGHHISMIFQEPMTSLNPVYTCGQQVSEALRLHKKLSSQEAREQTLYWFERVKLPNPAAIYDRYPHQLSGGQKQRVMIAMAMCCHPSLLICDEPTTALDVTVQKTILQLIRELQQESGMGVIFITHDLGVVAEVADRAAVMYRGEIVESGPVRDLFTQPKHPYTQALLACRPVNHPRGKRLPVVSDFWGNDKPQATKPDNFSTEKKSTTPEPLLKVEDLSVWFPVKKSFWGKPLQFTRAVDEVSFEVYKGETLGLVGESGCGKTTLGRTLLRLIEPTSGKIYYNGQELTARSGKSLQSMRRDIQIIFQDPYSSLNPRLTIGSAIAEPMRVHGIGESDRDRRDKVIELLEKVNLKAEHYNRYPHEFSGGQRQRIVIARALGLSPSFIICDESVSALDVSVQAQVLNLLNDLKKEFGFTVIFISHDLSVVRYISDRILVMNRGKIEEIGQADAVYFSPQSPYTRQLIASIPKGLPTQ
ncbi:ABC transporter ATP-binding protein [Nostoc ellipsosporum NOK]|nr:ABC transporter ATP-binding protein [Nostoc ellipsosporum NOK]